MNENLKKILFHILI